jgi:diamine N-acetyltransferase
MVRLARPTMVASRRLGTFVAAESGSPAYSFRKVSLAEAIPICNFGRNEMSKTFKHMYSVDDFQQYTDEEYTPEKYSAWIEDSRFLVHACYAGDAIVGYVLAGPCNLPVPSVSEEDAASSAMIHRIYIHRIHFGSGIAHTLMTTALQWLATTYPGKPVYLSVHPTNVRAQKFYDRYMFHPVGSYSYAMGNDTDRDYILRLGL